MKPIIEKPFIKRKICTENLGTNIGDNNHREDTINDYKEQPGNNDLFEYRTQPIDIPEVNNPHQKVDKLQEYQTLDKGFNVFIENSFMGCLENQNARKYNIEDSHMSFFRSLLPDLSKMNDKQIRKFKQGVFDLVGKIFEDPLVSVSPTYSPTSLRDSELFSPNYVPLTPDPLRSTENGVQKKRKIRRNWSADSIQ